MEGVTRSAAQSEKMGSGTPLYRDGDPTWLALAVLCAGTARGAGPSYSAAGIVNASNIPGPFAPNSVISVLEVSLARSTYALAAADLVPCAASLAGLCVPRS